MSKPRSLAVSSNSLTMFDIEPVEIPVLDAFVFRVSPAR